MRLEWTPSHSVGIEEIDEHQRNLYGEADRLVAAAGSENGELEAQVRRLLEVARAQFSAEERWLREGHEPAIVRHAHEHRRFLDDLVGIADQLARGLRPEVDALDLGEFVSTWIGSHASWSHPDLRRAGRERNARKNGANGGASEPASERTPTRSDAVP